MKAISLWQPWASLIACGAKQFETRSWAPPRDLIGQPIAIHAAKKIDKDAAAFAEELIHGQHGFDLADKLAASFSHATDEVIGIFGQAFLPIGCVVCTARLGGAFQLGGPANGADPPAATVTLRIASAAMHGCVTIPYDDFGDYSPAPAPAKGAQGFFDLPQGWLCAAGAEP